MPFNFRTPWFPMDAEEEDRVLAYRRQEGKGGAWAPATRAFPQCTHRQQLVFLTAPHLASCVFTVCDWERLVERKCGYYKWLRWSCCERGGKGQGWFVVESIRASFSSSLSPRMSIRRWVEVWRGLPHRACKAFILTEERTPSCLFPGYLDDGVLIMGV